MFTASLCDPRYIHLFEELSRSKVLAVLVEWRRSP